jgi:hypothetical protein
VILTRVQLIWVLGHEDTEDTETAIEHETVCAIAAVTATKAVKDWTNRNHKKHGSP